MANRSEPKATESLICANAYGFKESIDTFGYDGNGNLTRDPSKKVHLYYNHLNKMDSLVTDGGHRIRFYHDALGNLHRKQTIDSVGVSRDRDYCGQVELLNGNVDFIHHTNGYLNMLYSVPEELNLTGNEPSNNITYQALKITSSRNTSGNKTITYTAGEIDLLQSFNVVVGSSVTAQIDSFAPAGLAYTYSLRDHLGNNRVFFADKNNNGSVDTSEVISVHSYYPGGMDFGQKKSTNEEFGYRFGDKEELEYAGYSDFGQRCLDVTTCRFTSVDRFASKYPWQNPFAYAGSNPLKYIDVNGDSIDFSTLQNVDRIRGANNVSSIIADLQNLTGFTLTVGHNGNLSYSGDASGNPVISVDSDGNSAGSEEARKLLKSAIDDKGTAQVGYSKSRSRGGGLALLVSDNQINSFIDNTSSDLDNRTLGFGMTFLHELDHTDLGSGNSDSKVVGTTGKVVDRMNLIRSQLGASFGQRTSYPAVSLNSSMRPAYIPFSTKALGSLNRGVVPATSIITIK